MTTITKYLLCDIIWRLSTLMTGLGLGGMTGWIWVVRGNHHPIYLAWVITTTAMFIGGLLARKLVSKVREQHWKYQEDERCKKFANAGRE